MIIENMNFQDLDKIEDHQFYLDQAFKNSKKMSAVVFLRTSGERISRIRTTEYEKIKIFERTLIERLEKIIKKYPSIDSLPEFYQELIRATMDYDHLKKSLGSLNWTINIIKEISDIYKRKMKHVDSESRIKIIMKQYYGRISSIMNQIKSNLNYLEESRKIMKGFPSIKTDLYSIAITGFPNIGKSTLLSKLTTAKPEIKDYAFTTKNINLGYNKYVIHKIQFIDTPGVLAREKKNNIEQQAYLVLKYVANIIIYVIDLTEPYSLKEQERLLKGLKDYEKTIIIYLSKSDIISEDIIAKYKKKFKACTSLEELNKKIEKDLKKHFSQ